MIDKEFMDKYLNYLNKIGCTEYKDILLAIGVANKYDLEDMLTSNDSEFNRLIGGTQGNGTLTEVGKYRLLNDLIYCIGDVKILPSMENTSKVKKIVLKNFDIRNTYKELLDIEKCKKQLDSILNEDGEYGWYYELENRIKNYAKIMETYDGCEDLIMLIKKHLEQSNVEYPFKNIFVKEIELDKMKEIYRNDIKGYVEDTICHALVCSIMGRLVYLLNNKNATSTHYKMKLIAKDNYTFGTYSPRDYVPKLIVKGSFPSVTHSSALKIFDENKPFNIQNLENMIKILIYLYSKKATDLKKNIENMKLV